MPLTLIRRPSGKASSYQSFACSELSLLIPLINFPVIYHHCPPLFQVVACPPDSFFLSLLSPFLILSPWHSKTTVVTLPLSHSPFPVVAPHLKSPVAILHYYQTCQFLYSPSFPPTHKASTTNKIHRPHQLLSYSPWSVSHVSERIPHRPR